MSIGPAEFIVLAIFGLFIGIVYYLVLSGRKGVASGSFGLKAALVVLVMAIVLCASNGLYTVYQTIATARSSLAGFDLLGTLAGTAIVTGLLILGLRRVLARLRKPS